MSRIRYIKPGFFTDEDLADCDPLARILFAGLWTEADREGRLEDRPRRLKAKLLPYDDCSVTKLLDQLAAHGNPPLIVRYEACGKRYIAIPGWVEHQKPHSRELPSTIPEPTKHDLGSARARPRQCPSTDEAGLGTTQAMPEHDLGHPRARNGDGNLNRDKEDLSFAASAPNAADDDPDEVLEGEDVDDAPDERDDGFAAFYAVYPRKQAKLQARRAWGRLTREERELAVGVARVMGQLVAHGQQDRQFVQMPSSFLNGKRWEDWRDGIPPGWGSDGQARQADQEASIARGIALAFGGEAACS